MRFPVRGTLLFGVVIAAMLLASAGCGRSGKGMQKYVTQSAAFVLYAPKGWKVADACDGRCWVLEARDPDGAYVASLVTGCGSSGGDSLSMAKFFSGRLGQAYPDFQVSKAWKDPAADRVVFEGSFTPKGGPQKEYRCWVAGNGPNFLIEAVEAPTGKLAANREKLLTILASVRATNASMQPKQSAPATTAAPAKKSKLVGRKLSDGSASFLLPEDWDFVSLGKGHFVANDPARRYSIAVKETGIISPDNPFPAPAGVPVLAFMGPSRTFQALRQMQGIATQMKFLSVTPRPEAAKEAMKYYTSGPVLVEDFVFTCVDAKGQPYKGFSHAACNGSYQGKYWTFSDTTVAAPADEFDGYTDTFAKMIQSYQMDSAWLKKALAESAADLQANSAKMRAAVTDYGESTRTMIRQAYDERQKSQDYISYQRSQAIRGQADWVSSLEGGQVYHTDSWGTRNTWTGETYEGAPFDTVHFTGTSPKYNETLTPIDNRLVWEKHVNP